MLRSKFFGALVGLTAISLAACSTTDTTEPLRLGTGETVGEARLDSQLEDATKIFRTLLTSPDGGVPEQLLRSSQCIVLMPGVVKAAFIGGGQYGRGVVTCKTGELNNWTPPAFVQMTGGSIGWQIGAQSTDLVLFFTGPDSKAAVLNSTGLTLGADIGVAAGPVGRRADAKTNFSKTGIFSYASTQGIFAGISLEGAVMSPDRDSNKQFYGTPLSTADIIVDRKVLSIPPAAEKLLSVLPQG